MNNQNNILIVDDEPNVLSALKRVFIDDPYSIFIAGDAGKGLEFLENNSVKLVISDEMMPGMHGGEFLSLVRKKCPNTIRVMLTGHASVTAAMRAVNHGEIYRFFVKPWDDLELRLAIKNAIDKFDIEEENRKLLEIVRHQALNMKLLEKQFPGITKLDRDRAGRIRMPDVSEKEMSELIRQVEREFTF
ncbi:MAG: response regulator [Nitrospiraceae bacterium]|nr:response regulator [Nitrospiraceae bacterium]